MTLAHSSPTVWHWRAVLAQAARDLADEFAIDVVLEPMPPSEIGRYHQPTQTVYVRQDADPFHQAMLLEQVGDMLVAGPDAAPAATAQPALRLIPGAGAG